MKKWLKWSAGPLAAIMLMVGSMASVSAASIGERSLKTGAVGEDVQELQSSLKELGYFKENVDGIYGLTTEEAVCNFQIDKHITVDGVAGSETINRLVGRSTEQSRGLSRYKQVLDIVATAYAPGPHDNEKWGSLTHIGTQVRPGIIAVDPKVIPLRSRVYIEFPDGSGVYAVAEDTGGAIKGNRIDIAMWTVPEAENFGIQKVKVYVLN